MSNPICGQIFNSSASVSWTCTRDRAHPKDEHFHVGWPPYLQGYETDPCTPAEKNRGQVNDVAALLMRVWEEVEGEKVSVSRVATFADMAREVIRVYGPLRSH